MITGERRLWIEGKGVERHVCRSMRSRTPPVPGPVEWLNRRQKERPPQPPGPPCKGYTEPGTFGYTSCSLGCMIAGADERGRRHLSSAKVLSFGEAVKPGFDEVAARALGSH